METSELVGRGWAALTAERSGFGYDGLDRQPRKTLGLSRHKEFSRNCHTHDVEKLVGLARLEGARKTAGDADPEFSNNWVLAKDWSEERRYHRIDKAEAEALYAAIIDAVHGVFRWIKKQW